MPDLSVKNIRSAYGKKIVLKNFSYTFQEGKIYCILGPSGAGKSTLFNCLAAFQPIVQDGGQILLGTAHLGRTVAQPRGSKIANWWATWRLKHGGHREWHQLVQVIDQFPERQIFQETVLQDVAFGPHNFGHSRQEAEQMAQEALTKVGLPAELWGQNPFHLSDGQRRRLALAGILALNGEVLLADEPFAGLDEKGRQEIRDYLWSRRESGVGITILIVHDDDLALALGDECLYLQDGALRCSGTPYRFFNELRQQGISRWPRLFQVMETVATTVPEYQALHPEQLVGVEHPPRTLPELVTLMAKIHQEKVKNAE